MTRSYLGTKLGGDYATMIELAEWLRTDVAGTVEQVASMLRSVAAETSEIWTDGAGELFAGLADRGAKKSYALADKIARLVERVTNAAGTVAAAQGNLAALESWASTQLLDVDERGILVPEWGDITASAAMPVYDQAQHQAEYDRRVFAFDEAIDRVNAILEPIVGEVEHSLEQAVASWQDRAFKAGDLVGGTVSQLLEWQAHQARRGAEGARERAEMYRRRFWTASDEDQARRNRQWKAQELDHGERLEERAAKLGRFAKSVLGPLGIGVAGLEAGMALRRGEREGKVFLQVGAQVGTSLAVEAAGGLMLGALTLGPGGLLAAGMLVVVLGAASGWGMSWLAGATYDQLAPPSPLEKLKESGRQASERGRFGVGGYEPTGSG